MIEIGMGAVIDEHHARRRAGRFTWHRAVDRLAAIYDRISVEGQPSGSPCGYEDDEAAALLSGAAG